MDEILVLMMGAASRVHTLRCRIAAKSDGSIMKHPVVVVVVVVVVENELLNRCENYQISFRTLAFVCASNNVVADSNSSLAWAVPGKGVQCCFFSKSRTTILNLDGRQNLSLE